MNVKKILYYAVSSFQLLECITHRVTIHNNDDAEIIVSKYIPEKIPHIKKIENFFKKTYISDLQVNAQNENSYVENINKYYDKFAIDNNFDINSYNEIYVCAAHYIFGIYLVENNIKFNFIEDANGMLSRWETLEKIDSPYLIRASIAKRDGLYDGTANNINFCICNKSCQLDDKLLATNLSYFNVTEQLKLIDKNIRDEIISIFREVNIGKVYDEQERHIVLLTQHFCNLKIMSFEDQVTIYQTLFDFFVNQSEVYIKPHPDDLLYYGALFPKAKIIREKFPSEFLPFLFSKRVNCLATISSTSIFPLENSYKSILKFDTEYEKQFKLTLRTYIAIILLIKLGVKKINFFGVSSNMINNLLRFSDINKFGNFIGNKIECSKCCNNDDVFILGDNCSSEEKLYIMNNLLKSQTSFLYIGQEFYFYNFDYRLRLFDSDVIEIKKYRVREEDCYVDINSEYIYFYTKNIVMREVFKEFNMEKNLNNLGIDIEISREDAKDRKIKVLEGILKATEARLEYYVLKERETKRENEQRG